MKLYKRENYLKKIRGFYDADDIIKVITGVRRCGKSSLMEMIASELRDNGVSEENIIYLDLDRRGFKKVKTTDALEKCIDERATADGLKYLFIDEIQNVKDFEELINEYRSEGDWSIFITGSNSYLLSGELVTKLTGRYLEFEMFPLSFSEYEEMKKFYGKTINNNIQAELASYVLESGFPRTILIDDPADKRKYVQGVIKEIFEKDIRKRVKIRKKETLENMLYIYACSKDCSVSVGRIGKLECDFIIRNRDMNYSYVQVAYTIALSKETEDREFRPLEMITVITVMLSNYGDNVWTQMRKIREEMY